ncbi:hypothetical protein FKP32DRAFT_1456503 [Trametes sanguinea]|nr:hypothetical protein FKP32DRAFT_1456503 [Trametes sanguinea]
MLSTPSESTTVTRSSYDVSKITADDVFADRQTPSLSGLDLLRRDVALLTIANSGIDGGEVQVTKFPPEFSDEHAKLTILRHISTLLTTGCNASTTGVTQANAVTGLVHPNATAHILCAYDEAAVGALPSRSSTAQSPPAESSIVKINVSPEDGKRLLTCWATAKDPQQATFLTDHVQEIGSILSFLWSMPDASSEKWLPHFQCFMLRRARRKLAGRIEKLRTAGMLWREPPIEILKKWFDQPANRERVQDTTIKIPAISAFLSIAKQHNLEPLPDHDPPRFPLSSANVHEWINMLDDLLTRIQVVVLIKNHPLPSEEDIMIVQAVKYLQALHILLTSNLFRSLQYTDVAEVLRSNHLYPGKFKHFSSATGGSVILMECHRRSMDGREAP